MAARPANAASSKGRTPSAAPATAEMSHGPGQGEQTIDAVCPLLLRDAHQARRLLIPSLRAASFIGTLWIVAPPDEVTAVRGALEPVDVPFPIVVVPETEVIPELRYFPGRKRGWYRQQILKLAAAEIVDSEFFLTLDGDVCCLRPCTFETFIRDGRALLVVDSARPHPDWYRRASSVLGLASSGREMSVTPVIYSRQAIRELGAFVEQHVGRTRALRHVVPRGSEARRFLGGWRGIMLRSLPWVEMAVYLSFLDAMGRTSTFHWEDESRSFYGGNVWFASQADAWSPTQTVDRAYMDPEYYFVVLGSKTGMDPDEIVRALRPLLPQLSD